MYLAGHNPQAGFFQGIGVNPDHDGPGAVAGGDWSDLSAALFPLITRRKVDIVEGLRHIG